MTDNEKQELVWNILGVWIVLIAAGVFYYIGKVLGAF